jgi:O-antigen biosynthesis protein WbqP
MKRVFDVCVAGVSLLLSVVPMIAIGLLVKLSSRGPVLYWSRRVGQHNRIFQMPKIRTMRVDSPQIATHLLADSKRWITPIGHFLRKTSLDEVPQLWSVLRGDMSLVGPRPALFNQDDLVAQRTTCGVHRLVPGLTGWAQINGRDELEIPQKVAYDQYYLHHKSFLFDLKILLLTFVKVLQRDGVKQADDFTASTTASRTARESTESRAA